MTISVKLRYSDGHVVFKTFATEKELNWYVHTEGDHLLEVIYVKDIHD